MIFILLLSYREPNPESLLALPGTTLHDIQEIRSHPYAIEQCRKFLSTVEKKIVVSQAFDTAGSAQIIKNKNLTGV